MTYCSTEEPPALPAVSAAGFCAQTDPRLRCTALGKAQEVLCSFSKDLCQTEEVAFFAFNITPGSCTRRMDQFLQWWLAALPQALAGLGLVQGTRGHQ